MANFFRSDLIGFYDWPIDGNNNPKTNGEPGDLPFERSNGYEVLYMVRKIMAAQNLVSIEAGQEIEIMIKVAPPHLQTQQEVMQWILTN